ncbi:MAG: hypothetical protein WA214_26845, partial [Pseudolabrys sp.]
PYPYGTRSGGHVAPITARFFLRLALDHQLILAPAATVCELTPAFSGLSQKAFGRAIAGVQNSLERDHSKR